MQAEIDSFIGIERIQEEGEKRALGTDNGKNSDILYKLQRAIADQQFDQAQTLQYCEALLASATRTSSVYEAVVTVMQRTKQQHQTRLLHALLATAGTQDAIEEKNLALVIAQVFAQNFDSDFAHAQLNDAKRQIIDRLGAENILSQNEINKITLFSQVLHIPFTVARLARELRQSTLQQHLKQVLEILELLLYTHVADVTADELVAFTSVIIDAYFVNISLSNDLQKTLARIEKQLNSLQGYAEESLRFEEMLAVREQVTQAHKRDVEQSQPQFEVKSLFV